MLDTRLITFLTVCHEKSYTKAAQKLFITQPAVSQQIKSLEDEISAKLFSYKNKLLHLTDAGLELFRFVSAIQSDIIQELPIIAGLDKKKKYHFGATKTIGDYIMPEIIKNILTENPSVTVDMLVDNTHILLEYLNSGKIYFALIEGLFDKNEYASELFSTENFICACSSHSPLKNGSYTIYDLLNENIILREHDSGSRNIFEHYLTEKNLSVNSFSSVCSAGSIHTINYLVENKCGISFMFEKAAHTLINDGKLCIVDVLDFPLKREFNMVWLKGSYFSDDYSSFASRYFKIQPKKQQT